MNTLQWQARDRHAKRMRSKRQIRHFFERFPGKCCEKCGELLTEATGVVSVVDILNITPADSRYCESKALGTHWYCKEHTRESYWFAETAQGRFVKLDETATDGAWPLTREQLSQVYGA